MAAPPSDEKPAKDGELQAKVLPYTNNNTNDINNNHATNIRNIRY